MFDYAAYARQLRHELHQCPEIGFELTQTTSIVRRELEHMGIAYTEAFCQGSIVATINEGKAFTIGLRADMDGLPIKEAGGNPYPSRIEGNMHACGHDVHTAQMLAVARQLNDMRDSLHCCVKILFTPAEEYITPGCKVMAENGAMDDVDVAIACHVHPGMEVGKVMIHENGYNANSMGVVAEFFGKSSHAHFQHNGVDAIRMAVQAYIGLELMIARELPPKDACLLNVGALSGGKTNNIVCDYAKMFLSARSWDDDQIALMERRIREICDSAAQMGGGTAKVTVTKLIPYVKNDPAVLRRLRLAAEKAVGKENVVSGERSLGGEDFAFFSRKKPCAMFRQGISNGENPDTRVPLHNDHFDVDEGCFQTGISVFVNFVLENQDGSSF